MLITRLTIFVLFLSLCSQALAQTTTRGTTTIKATATPSPSINLGACYQTTAKKSGSTFDGRVAVGILCKQKTDLLLNDQFSTNDTTSAKPVLERRRLVLSGTIPNGVEYGLLATGGVNKFYEVQIAATCCPLNSK